MWFCCKGYVGVVTVLGLMLVTLYMAFAFPYSLLHLRQTETSEIKSVIIIGQSGETTPSLDSYFVGEEPLADLHRTGQEQLSNVGRERMFLLGKFLRLRYYQLLLNGNPRKIYARSVDLDHALDSSQALLAGLNPPKDGWLWSSTGEMNNWQPQPVHTTELELDELLGSQTDCPKLELDRLSWKNSSRYQQLLNEFRHDMQTLRANTGLDFQDDLETLTKLSDALKARAGFQDSSPAWFTSTFAQRLAHVADVSTESRYSSLDAQRLLVGRLLHDIAQSVEIKIKLQQSPKESETNELESESAAANPKSSSSNDLSHLRKMQQLGQDVIVYMTDKEHLSALLNSLHIYTSEPQFGFVLLIELHHEPITQAMFLRLFTVSSPHANLLPEPVRVQPLACVDSAECNTQQFVQNIRHLMLDKTLWREACSSNQLAEQFSTTQATSNDHFATTTTTQESTSTLDKLDQILVVGPTNVAPSSVTNTSQEPIVEVSTMMDATSTSQPQVSDELTTTTTSAETEQSSSTTRPTTSMLNPPYSLVNQEVNPMSLSRDIYYQEN